MKIRTIGLLFLFTFSCMTAGAQGLPKIIKKGVKAAGKASTDSATGSLFHWFPCGGLTGWWHSSQFTSPAAMAAQTQTEVTATPLSLPAGDVLMRIGGFHLYMNNAWYLVHADAVLKQLPQRPSTIIYPSKVLTHPVFSEYLEKHQIQLDPQKSSPFDAIIKATELQQNPGILPRLREELYRSNTRPK